MIRVGLIGAGWVAEQHLAALQQIEDVKIGVICDVSGERAQLLASQCGADVCDSPREAIRSVDVVYVLTPPDVRPGLVIEAASAKKPMFIEKPFALTLSEADRQIEAVERAGVIAYVGFVVRKFATFGLLRSTFASGELGDLVTAWTRRIWYRNVPEGHYQTSMARSGGLTTELNVHDFDWMRWVGGDVQSVYGRTIGTREGRDVEENSWSILNFKQGIGCVGTSWLSSIADSSAGIIGTRGTVLLQGSKVTKQLIDSDKVERQEFVDERVMPDAFLAEDREFIQCVCDNGKPSATVYDGRKSTEIALAVLESSRKNQVVQLPLG